jgi:hypothetical protein
MAQPPSIYFKKEKSMTALVLKNVRLSFPQIWTPKAFAAGQDPRFNANFLIHKEDQAELIAKIKEAVKAVATEKWGKDVPKSLKVCIGDGEEKDYDGYDGAMFLSASTKTRPVIVDQKKNPLAEEDGKPYAGCYVNAAISLWAQDNQWGKRVNASLDAIQFVKDGDAFGGKKTTADVFGEIEEDDNDSFLD